MQRDSSYTVLRVLAGESRDPNRRQARGDYTSVAQALRTRFDVCTFAVYNPESHRDFQRKVADIDPLTFADRERRTLLFAPIDPPDGWVTPDPERVPQLELTPQMRALMNLEPDLAIRSENSDVAATSLAAQLRIPHGKLPCLVATPDLTSRHVTILPTHAGAINQQLEELGILASSQRDAFWIIGDHSRKRFAFRQAESCGQSENVVLPASVASILADQQSLNLTSDHSHPHHEQAVHHAKTKLAKLRENYGRRRVSRQEHIKAIERISDPEQRRLVMDTFDTLDRNVKEMEELCEDIVKYLAVLPVEHDMESIKEFVDVEARLFERESQEILKSAYRVFLHLRSPSPYWPSDYYPIVIALAKIFEREINLSIIQLVRKLLSIGMPEYYNKYQPSTTATLDGVNFNDNYATWLSEVERQEPRDTWYPPSLGKAKRACAKLHNTAKYSPSSPELGNCDLVALKKLSSDWGVVWKKRVKSVIWDILIAEWEYIVEHRNKAAHETRMGSLAELENVRTALNNLSYNGVLTGLYDMKLELSGQSIFSEIADLANLEFRDNVKIRHDDNDIRDDKLRLLYDAWLCRDSEVRNRRLNFGERRDLAEEIAIADLLGDYDPDKGEIVIYDEACRIAAKEIKVKPHEERPQTKKITHAQLQHVILVHQVAHAVAHLGRDACGREWRHYGVASTHHKELFAQAYSLFYFRQQKQSWSELIFRKLARRQGATYNSWRDYEKTGVSDLNAKLLEVRALVGEVLDRELMASINTQLGRRPDARVSERHLRGLARLGVSPGRTRGSPRQHRDMDLRRKHVLDLTGIEVAHKLEDLSVEVYQIGDLTPLAMLVNLKRLRLYSCGSLDDLRPVSKLIALLELDLSHSRIRDPRPISSLTNLRKLKVADTAINDLNPIARIANLRILNLGGNGLIDIGPIERLAASLTGLKLYRNKIEDLQPLSKLTDLTDLDLYRNSISNLSPLSGLVDLTALCVDDNSISDLEPLSSLENLRSLSLEGNPIDDLAPIVRLPKLQTLRLGPSSRRVRQQAENLKRIVEERGERSSIRIGKEWL